MQRTSCSSDFFNRIFRSAVLCLSIFGLLALQPSDSASLRPVRQKSHHEPPNSFINGNDDLNDAENRSKKPTPLVIWHGFNDSAEGIQFVVNFFQEQVPGLYASAIQIGNDCVSDIENSVFMEAHKQVDVACEAIKSNKRLRHGYNAIGLSQGGLFMRTVAEYCPDPPIRNLITFGTPHQGIYGVPNCRLSAYLCRCLNYIINDLVYNDDIQEKITLAQYWHNPLNKTAYQTKSSFLAEINNERDHKNRATFKKNLLKLENFVMVKFASEDLVIPPNSEWFGFFADDGQTCLQLKDMPIYKEDWLGLRELDLSGRLHFLESPGKHLKLDFDWIEKNVMKFILN